MNEEAVALEEPISNTVTRNRKRLMGFGILSLLFGIIGIFMSTVVTITSMIFFGILVIVGGVIFLVESFSAPKWKGKILSFMLALLYLVAGVVMITNPEGSAIWFTLFIASFVIAICAMRIIRCFQIKNELNEWGWMVFAGVLNIVLGLLIYAQWPYSGLWIIGLFISIELMIQGINAIVLSRSVKSAQKDLSDG